MVSVVCAVLTLGFSGMIAQVVLLRELLVVFSGNELFMGLFIGLWVLGEAIGALWSERINRAGSESKALFVVVTIGFLLLWLFSLLLARGWKPLCGIPHEVSSGVWTLVTVSTLVLLPVAVMHGFLFISACVLFKGERLGSNDPVGLTYSWETVGSIIGGILASWFLVRHLSSFDIILLLAFLNSGACLLLLARKRGELLLLKGAVAGVGFLSIVALFTGSGQLLHEKSVAWQWRGANPVSYLNSHYQNIVVTENSGQYTLFTNGLAQITLPLPDIERVEELAHFPLLMHADPRTVLVIGGGAGGLITEVAKHRSVRRIDYLEPDPLLLKTVRELPPEVAGGGLADPKVNLINEDGAVFLKRGAQRYDLAIMNLPLPETLQANRFFTRRFFASVRNVLNPGGMLALPSTGSATYYANELRMLNASLSDTLGEVFPSLIIIPGHTNIFIAGAATIPEPDTAVLTHRQEERGVETKLITPEHLSYRLAQEGRKWLAGELAQVQATVNEDFSPALMYWNIAYSSRIHTSVFSAILNRVNRLNGTLVAAIAVSCVVIAAAVIGRARRTALSLAVAGTGMASMLGELLLMTVFQVFYGSLFHLVGMLLALFMAGIALGAYFASLPWVMRRSGRRVIIWLESAMIGLFVVQALFLSVVDRGGFESLRLALLLAGVGFTGVLTGMTYPVASRLYRGLEGTRGGGGSNDSVTGAGLIYAADLLGGCIGGTVGAVLLLPAFGVTGSFFLLGLIKASTALLFVRAWREGS